MQQCKQQELNSEPLAYMSVAVAASAATRERSGLPAHDIAVQRCATAICGRPGQHDRCTGSEYRRRDERMRELEPNAMQLQGVRCELPEAAHFEAT